MDKELIERSLTSMGYRDSKRGVWLKPVGYHMFVYLESSNLLYNCFKNLKGELDSYNGKYLTDVEDVLEAIKQFEAYNVSNVNPDSEFEFDLKNIHELR